MQPRLSRRSPTRRGAPPKPKRRKRLDLNPFLRSASGFEGLLPADGSEDFFFASFVREPDEAAEFLEHGEVGGITADPRLGVTASAALHLLILLLILIEPTLELLGNRPPEDAKPPEKEPLVAFFEPPETPAPLVVPLVPAPAPDAAPEPERPPQTADDRLLIPKAMLPPPEDKVQEFMNDLPFSKGNTEEFFTDEEVKDPGAPGEEPEPEKPVEEPEMVPESGEDEILSEKAEGEEAGNGGTDVADARALGDLIFGDPRLREERRPKADIRPPEPKPQRGEIGVGGEDGAFTDIRRFLAGARFENPEGGLVANTGNTLYYNDKGANFVPWLRRMLAEVRRNWFVPYSVAFQHGHVAVAISVARDGRLLELKVLIPSGTSGFDNAAVGALRASQLLPLPADYPDDRFELILVFWYNERPYDLFG
jgi:TonB family protein